MVCCGARRAQTRERGRQHQTPRTRRGLGGRVAMRVTSSAQNDLRVCAALAHAYLFFFTVLPQIRNMVLEETLSTQLRSSYDLMVVRSPAKLRSRTGGRFQVVRIEHVRTEHLAWLKVWFRFLGSIRTSPNRTRAIFSFFAGRTVRFEHRIDRTSRTRHMSPKIRYYCTLSPLI